MGQPIMRAAIRVGNGRASDQNHTENTVSTFEGNGSEMKRRRPVLLAPPPQEQASQLAIQGWP
jgi:hypothetical protein